MAAWGGVPALTKKGEKEAENAQFMGTGTVVVVVGGGGGVEERVVVTG